MRVSQSKQGKPVPPTSHLDLPLVGLTGALVSTGLSNSYVAGCRTPCELHQQELHKMKTLASVNYLPCPTAMCSLAPPLWGRSEVPLLLHHACRHLSFPGCRLLCCTVPHGSPGPWASLQKTWDRH